MPVAIKQFSLADVMRNAENIRNSQLNRQLAQHRFQQQMQEDQQAQSLRDLFANQGADINNPEFQRQVMAASPAMGMRLSEYASLQQNRQAETQKQMLMDRAKVAANIMQKWDETGRDQNAFPQIIGSFAPVLSQLKVSPEDAMKSTPENIEALARHGGYIPEAEKTKQAVTLATEKEKALLPYEKQKAEVTGGMPFETHLTTKGYQTYNKRLGQWMPQEAEPFQAPASDVERQAELARQKASATAAGKAQGQAAVDLPKTVAQGEQTIQVVDELLNHPGLSSVIGVKSWGGIPMAFGKEPMGGTEAAGAYTLLKQVRSKAFLDAFRNWLRGGGQITEIEGQKATEALIRAQEAQNEKDFVKSMNEFKNSVQIGTDLAKRAAAGNFAPMENASARPMQPAQPAMTKEQLKALYKQNPADAEKIIQQLMAMPP